MEVAPKFRQLLDWCQRWWLYWLLAVVLVMHLAVVSFPAEPMFDEQHYVPDARSILQGGSTARAEHPPLGKLIIAAGIAVLGDNPYGWRLGSVIFGTAAVVFLYLICRRLNLAEGATFFSVFIFAFENLSFVQASIAMLDVFSVTLALAAFWLYLRGDYPLAAVAVGLSALTKLTGILAGLVLALHWVVAGRKSPWRFISSMFLVPVTVLTLLPVFDFLVSGRLVNPIYSLRTMMELSSSLTFNNTSHPSLSRPWEWLLFPLLMPYWYQPHYTAAISFTVWALIVPSMAYLVFRAIRYRCDTAIFCLVWFLITYLLWIPFSLLTNRISFVYYFYPTVGAVCIAIGSGLYQLYQLRDRTRGCFGKAVKALVVGYLAGHLAVFVALSPLSSFPT